MKRVLVIFFALFVQAAFAQSSISYSIKNAQIHLGYVVYANRCNVCHNVDQQEIKIGPFPPIKTSSLWNGPNSSLINFILYSRPGSIHPAHNVILSPADISNLLHYMQGSIERKGGSPASENEVIDEIAKKYRQCTPEAALN